MDGISNLKKIHPGEFISGQKSFLQPTEKRVLHISISPMVKFNRLSLITPVKRRVYQKNTTKKEKS